MNKINDLTPNEQKKDFENNEQSAFPENLLKSSFVVSTNWLWTNLDYLKRKKFLEFAAFSNPIALLFGEKSSFIFSLFCRSLRQEE